MNPRLLLAVWLPVVIVSSAARAEELVPAPDSALAPESAPASEPALESAPAPEPATEVEPAPAPAPAPAARAEFRTVVRGIVLLGLGLDAGPFGGAIRGIAGAQWTETRTIRDRRFVLRWDGRAHATAGGLGSTFPFRGFVGGQLEIDGEAGVRFLPRNRWSPYVGAGVSFRVSAVALPSVPMSQYDTINDPRGLAGVNGMAALRVSAGASEIGTRHALHLTGFVQESARAPETFSRTDAFTEVGVRAQLDIPENLQAAIEGVFGRTVDQTDPVARSTNEGTFLGASVSARKLIRRRFWLGLDLRVGQRRDRTSYAGGLTYETKGLVSTAGILSWGFVL